jgi:hypothetical protein
MVSPSEKRPVSRANGWPGYPKPRGVSRMARTHGHYRPAPPLMQGMDRDLPEMPARPS